MEYRSACFGDLIMLVLFSMNDAKDITEHFPSSSNDSAEGIEAGAMVVVRLVVLADDPLETGEK